MPAATVLGIGLVAGTLDITDNIVFNHLRGITAKMIFQYIAAGLIGADAAARAGYWSVALGVALHYFIALSWTVVLYLASRRFGWLLRRPVPSGLAYGALVYLVMNVVVLPLSRVPQVHSTMTPANRINGVLAVMVCIGLTAAVLLARAAERGAH